MIREYLKKVEEKAKWPDYRPLADIIYRAAKEALDKGLDREQFFQYIASTLLHTTHEIAKQHPHITPSDVKRALGESHYFWLFLNMTEPYFAIGYLLTDLLKDVEKEYPEAKKYREELEKLLKALGRAKGKAGIRDWIENPGIAYSALTEIITNTPLEKYAKTPEEILGIKPSLQEPLSRYKAWLVDLIVQAIRDMDVEEIADLIASCCSGECILERLGKQY